MTTSHIGAANSTAIDSRLSGRRALITGANRGIGAAIVRRFVRSGARVAINYFEDEESAKALVHELGPDIAGAVKADLRHEEQIGSMFKEAVHFLGGLDILVNNAGCESVVPAIDLQLVEWNRILETNLTGPFLCSQHAARLMCAQGTGGVILNNSSMHASIPRLGLAHYCSSKAGLAMLTRSLGLEWAKFGIRVAAVAPGAVETEVNRAEIEAFGRSRFEEWIPLSRLGEVDDIANDFAFLASDEASYVTGTTITVDGAYSLTTIK